MVALPLVNDARSRRGDRVPIMSHSQTRRGFQSTLLGAMDMFDKKRVATASNNSSTAMSQEDAAALKYRPGDAPRIALRHKLLTIDEILHSRPQMPIASSRERGWGGVTLDLHQQYFDCAERYPGLDHHLICYCPEGSGRLVQTRGGVVHDSVISAGNSYIMPAGYESTWEGDASPSARLRIPVSLVSAAADEIYSKQRYQVEIQNVFEVSDLTIERLALTLMSEIERKNHPVQLLIVDSISNAIALHLLRDYNTFPIVKIDNQPSLSQIELGQLVDYIESNLDRTIGLSELAALVHVSRFHFSRLFKRSTGSTPIDFVEQSRIRRAQTLIIQTTLPLAEIALITGFADQSHFTRRFRNRVGCTPAAFSRDHGRRRTTRQSLSESV